MLTNALAGRLRCGFARPQTVWTDLFLLVERLIEGDRRLRLKNIGAPLIVKRIAQIAAKHSAWILISLVTGGTLIFYFTDAPDLLRGFAQGGVSVNVGIGSLDAICSLTQASSIPTLGASQSQY